MAEDLVYDKRIDRMVSAYPSRFTIKYRGLRVEHDGYGSLAFAVGPRMMDVHDEDVHHSGCPISKEEMVAVAKRIVDSHPEWIEQAKNTPPGDQPIFHPDYVRRTPQVTRRVPKVDLKPRKVFIKGEAKEKKLLGVKCLVNAVSNTVEINTVARYNSWDDAIRGMKGWYGFQIYQGVPITQEKLTTHYPELKRYTGLTKSKIGSGKVLFKNVDMPMVVQHKEYAYMVAPTMGEDKASNAATKQPLAATKKPALIPSVPPILTAPPELAADVLGAGLTPTAAPKPKKTPKRKPAPDMPPVLAAPPELAADVLGTGPMGLTPTAAPKPKKQPKKTAAAKTRKTTKKAAKPKTKKTAAAPKLTASQKEYLAIQGFVMVKRGGKYVTITN